ncbi:MAG: alpha-amylase family glycosyl hydrolase [Chloroflexota bacterium]
MIDQLPRSKTLGLLSFVYDEATAADLNVRLAELIDKYRSRLSHASGTTLTHKDAILITYGDMVQYEDQPHLQTLNQFLSQNIQETISTVHILPFYPWSSDDGFSVIDYLAIDPPLGGWDEVAGMRQNFRLMFDAVINHISQHSDWFSRFKAGESPYTDYFKTVDPETDLSAVFRPRALPLLTPVETASGTKHVWTTFSADQIDLNYESPELLLEVMTVLLEYVAKGAELIRLDAIGFMWKVPGTRSLHLPEAHAIIQLMRAVLDEMAPHVQLITETNVPHQENISYFGDGYNEAQMVYNFSLPPLLMHAFHTGNAQYLTDWAASLDYPSERTTFFNFCASHDGIGVTPARGILPAAEIEEMAQRVEALGGRVSYKNNSDGTQSAYELNINYLNGLGVPDADESDELKAKRFVASQAVMLALQGVPGIYFHSLFGSENWQEGVAQTGHNRTINRQKLDKNLLEQELKVGLRKLVFEGYLAMLTARGDHAAFNPYGAHQLLRLHPSLVAIERHHAGETVLCLQNVSSDSIEFQLPESFSELNVIEIIGSFSTTKKLLKMSGYDVVWLKMG